MSPSSPSEIIRVVMAAPQPDRVSRSVANLMAAADRPVDVEIVLYGQGIDLLLVPSRSAEAENLRDCGATVLACSNTLRGRGVGPEALPAWAGVVEAAVWHLALRQHQGWSLVPVW